MKTRCFALAATVCVVCLATGTLSGSSEEQAPEKKNAPPIERLLDRIEELEARVAQLEKRQAMVAIPYQQPIPPSIAPQVPYAQGQPVPKGWKRKEFNGQYYYIVPLDSPGRETPPTPHAR